MSTALRGNRTIPRVEKFGVAVPHEDASANRKVSADDDGAAAARPTRSVQKNNPRGLMAVTSAAVAHWCSETRRSRRVRHGWAAAAVLAYKAVRGRAWRLGWTGRHVLAFA
jgi:hypothetical protein